jgi:hypothetical protein
MGDKERYKRQSVFKINKPTDKTRQSLENVSKT